MMRLVRGFTLVETLVASSVLLVMVALTSMAIVGYLRSYRAYTERGLRCRVAAKTLETVCRRLRSAESLQAPLPRSLRDAPLQFVERGLGLGQLELRSGQLVITRGEEVVLLGAANDLELRIEGGLLRLSLPLADQPPLQTGVSLRGVRL